ncbi:MAG: hypothetical protein M3081_05370 [Gemmatimonadota bacterium]|nr:hypothetical protein [Gemmatimonadota bacterium]
MDSSKTGLLKIFLRVYGALSLVLFSALLLGFIVQPSSLDVGGGMHWLIWDHVSDHVAPMLLAVYVVWSIFILRAARDPLAHAMFLDFTIWANVAHAIAMVPHALASPEYHIKFLTDIPWVLLPVIVIPLLRPSRRTVRGMA